MSMIGQILWGSLLLGCCVVVHVAGLIAAVLWFRVRKGWLQHTSIVRRLAFLLAVALAAIVGAHTIEVWLWAATLIWIGALPGLNEALYFGLVTYTTLGYGDVTLAPEFRIFGAFASVAGLLTFGLSSAFLVGLFVRLLPGDIGPPQK